VSAPLAPSSRPVVQRLVAPPFAEPAFWLIQSVVIVIVIVHYLFDFYPSLAGSWLQSGLPVATIGSAALRYGLPGSLGTTAWSMVLWLPDLLLPHGEGHPGDDLANFAIIVIVAVVFGRRVEWERTTQAGIDAATARALAVEADYHRLFESTRSPILVLDEESHVVEANPAADELFGTSRGRSLTDVLPDLPLEEPLRRVVTLANGHDYRVDVVDTTWSNGETRRQLSLEDVTAERTEERQTRLFAAHIVEVEEAQRAALAREIHDEPLQLFLQLARRLELVASSPHLPDAVREDLGVTRQQTLDTAARLRTLSRDLRPPALDQLGLVPALRSLVAEHDDGAGLLVELGISGSPSRLSPDVELGAFRIVQESLRNVARHAHARQVRVNVEFLPTEVRLMVSDDGVGFRPRHAPEVSTTSLGLVGMRERARLLNGHFSIDSTLGVGTVVHASLPARPRPSESRASEDLRVAPGTARGIHSGLFE
jgi:PAS domain S-box-containing protein